MITKVKPTAESATHQQVRIHVESGDHEAQKRVNANIPKSLFDEFKIRLVQNDESMRDALMKMIRDYVK